MSLSVISSRQSTSRRLWLTKMASTYWPPRSNTRKRVQKSTYSTASLRRNTNSKNCYTSSTWGHSQRGNWASLFQSCHQRKISVQWKYQPRNASKSQKYTLRMYLLFQVRLSKLRLSSLETMHLMSLLRISLKFALLMLVLRSNISKVRTKSNFHSSWWSCWTSSSIKRFQTPSKLKEASSQRLMVHLHRLIRLTKNMLKIYQTKTLLNTTRRTICSREKLSC